MLPRKFKIPAQIAEVDPLILLLKATAEELMGPDQLLSLELAAIEALTNIVVHGCAHQPDAIIKVELSAGSGSLSLMICDPGRPLQDRAFENALDLDQIDPTAQSGRGIAMIKACSDVIIYTHTPEQNCLTLIFRNGKAL